MFFQLVKINRCNIFLFQLILNNDSVRSLSLQSVCGCSLIFFCEDISVPTLKQLQYFSAIAHTGNMTQVAAMHFISQSALSNSIHSLEEELGVPLFDRANRSLILNSYGKSFLMYADSVCSTMQEAYVKIKEMRSQKAGSVSIRISSPLYWGDVIGSFLAKHSSLSLWQREIDLSEVHPELDVDFLICGEGDIDCDQMETQVLFETKLYLYVAKEHPFASRTSLSLSEAKNETFILLPDHVGFSLYTKRLFEKVGFKPRASVICDYTLRRDLLRQNAGVVLATDCSKRVHFFDGYGICLPLEDNVTRKMIIAWSKSRKLSEPCVLFRDFMIDYYRNNPN